MSIVDNGVLARIAVAVAFEVVTGAGKSPPVVATVVGAVVADSHMLGPVLIA